MRPGWVVQGDKRVKDGKTLAVKLVIPSGVAVSRSESAVIQNLLAQINVLVESQHRAVDLISLTNTLRRVSSTSPFSHGWARRFPLARASRSIKSRQAPTFGRTMHGPAAMKSTGFITKPPRNSILRRRSRRQTRSTNSSGPKFTRLPTYQRPDIWAAKKTLANMGAYGFASIIYEDIGWMAESDGK